jgi:hypothetical protein
MLYVLRLPFSSPQIHPGLLFFFRNERKNGRLAKGKAK